MSISVTCSCGAKLKAPDGAAGKTVACPKCKARVKVPSLAPAPGENATPDVPVRELAKALPEGRRPARRRGFPLWATITIITVLSCSGLLVVALVAITALGTAAPHSSGVELEQAQHRISVDPEIKDLEFGNWKLVRGTDRMGREGTWLVTTIKAVGTNSVRDLDFNVTLYDKEGVKVIGGAIVFPNLKPSEAGEVQVRIDDAYRGVISKRKDVTERPNKPADKSPDIPRAGNEEGLRWDNVGKTGQVGDVSIESPWARSSWANVKDLGEWKQWNFFVVKLKLTNTSPTKVVNFKGWQGVATLVDEHGNKYRAIHFDEIGFEGFGDVGWNSQLDQEYNKSSETNAILAYNLSLHPGKSYITYLFYEKSAAVAKEARLTLPSKELGGTGTIRLLVPISNPAVERVVNPAEGPASKPPNEFTIVQAKFGTGADWADVKEQVRKLVKDSRLHLIVPREGSALPQLGFPDPAPNRLKQLVVVYAVNGKQQSVTVEAGQELNLPPVGQVNSPPAKPAEKPAEAPIRKGTITFYVVVNSPGYFDSTGVKRNYRIGDTGTFPKSNPLTKTYRLNELSKDMIGHTVLCVKVRKDGAIIAQVREITSASGQGLAAYFSRAFVVKGLDVKKLNLKDKSVWDPGEEEYKVTGTEKNATGDVFLVFEPVKPDKVEPAGKDADRKHKE